MFNVSNELINLVDKDFKSFNEKVIPDTNRELLGVRIPLLRNLAKKIVKEDDWKGWLEVVSDKYFEEILLQGLVIAYAKDDFKTKIPLIKKFIPKMDSWAITDSFVPTLKIKNSELELVFNFINSYLNSNKEYEIRFGIIMLLDYFIVDDYVEKVIEILDKINHEGYYVKMAAAWCLAEIGIKYNDLLMEYLNGKNNLDDFTFNKTLQKMIESYRISKEQKEVLRKMKRKNKK